jgi:hypothetical protein
MHMVNGQPTSNQNLVAGHPDNLLRTSEVLWHSKQPRGLNVHDWHTSMATMIAKTLEMGRSQE